MKRTFAIAAATALAGMLAFSVGAFAARPPGVGHGNGGGGGQGGGGGGGGGEEAGANNLSVPTIVIGYTDLVDCSARGLVTPTGDPLTGYPIDPAAWYYVQGVNTWRADCLTIDNNVPTVNAYFGDNLGGEAKLSVGAPIRVELLATLVDVIGDVPTQGYIVDKLNPAALDRESAYGTEATPDGDGFLATVATFLPDDSTAVVPEGVPWPYVLVYDADATLKIQKDPESDGVVVVEGPASAEINATGKVVYGYNLRVVEAGTYRITYTLPNVSIRYSDIGAVDSSTEVSLNIEVTTGTGGGGGGGHGKP